MQMSAISGLEPGRLVRGLMGRILDSGGWVLSRDVNDMGRVKLLFEFERQDCVEIYSALVAAGLELSQRAHLQMTALCQCTRFRPERDGAEIASMDLEIQTFPLDAREDRPISYGV